MHLLIAASLLLASLNAHARPFDCVRGLARVVTRKLQRGEPSGVEFERARAAFDALPAGSFKTRLAIREIHSLGSAKSAAHDAKRDLYFSHLVYLFHGLQRRSELLTLPAPLIRAAAEAYRRAEDDGVLSPRDQFPGYFPEELDVSSILLEKARR